MNGGPRRTGGLHLSRGFGWAARYRRRRAVLTLTAARVISDTTRRRPARSVPPEVEAGALKAVLGVLADGAGVAASTDPSGVGDGGGVGACAEPSGAGVGGVGVAPGGRWGW